MGSLTGILPLLLALLALVAIVPLKDGLRYGIAVWLLVSAVSLLIPGKKDSTLIFALFGYYPLVRDRIASCKSCALRSGIRFAIILITGTAIFSTMILFCPDLLPPEIADSRGLLLDVYLTSYSILLSKKPLGYMIKQSLTFRSDTSRKCIPRTICLRNSRHR